MLGVIVLNWNGGQDLINCLKSVFASEDCGTEIVVYVPDNASTDGSIEAVQRDFPQTRVIQNGGNLGFSGGNNPGWRQAVAEGAEWIFFLNNDAALAPDCLRRMLDIYRANPQIGAASPKIYYGTPETHPDGKRSPDAEPEIWFEQGLIEFNSYYGIRHVDATPSERDSVWYESPLSTGCCFLTTSKLLEETGGFDEGFFAYFEDVDLSLKIRAKGLVCAVIPSAISWHKVGQSTSKAATPGYVFYCARTLYYLAERHARRPDVWAEFRKIYPRQNIGLAVHHANEGSNLMGATFLQGFQCAMRGQKGPRPKKHPSLALRSATEMLRRFYNARNHFRRKRWERSVRLTADPTT